MVVIKSFSGIAARLRALAGLVIGLALVCAGAAQADYRDSIAVLRIGLVQNRAAASDPVKLEAVQRAFSDALSIQAEIIRLPNYAALIDAHASGRIGYAIHSARSFAATEAACRCISPLRGPVAADGSTGFRSVLVVRDSVNLPVSELTVGYSDEASVSGWQIPLQAMKAGSLEQPTLVRAGSVTSVIELYRTGRIDGFFAWLPDMPEGAGSDIERVFGGWNSQEISSAGPLRLVWSSQRIPYGPHAVHRSLPDDLVARLGEFLDGMATTAPGLLDMFEPSFAGGFTVPDPEDYRNARGLVEALKDPESASIGHQARNP